MTLSDLQEQLVEDLAVAIAEHRGGAGAGNAARALLEKDSTTQLLVGLAEGARKVVYYDSVMWGVQMHEFDAEGVQPAPGSQVDKCRHRDDLELWVWEHQEELAWVHPRFRWALPTIDGS